MHEILGILGWIVVGIGLGLIGKVFADWANGRYDK